MEKTYVHTHKVEYEGDDDEKGVRHLKYDLSKSEAEPLFEYAKKHGSARFEDDQDRDFVLSCRGISGSRTYTVTRRHESY